MIPYLINKTSIFIAHKLLDDDVIINLIKKIIQTTNQK